MLAPRERPWDHAQTTAPIGEAVRWPVRIGVLLIVVFVGGFGLWATVVPLAGGAIATGVISPDGSTRTVQHLEGGIIQKLLVRDGDVVEKGQTLLILENVQPRASHDLLHRQAQTLLATQIRLEAEQSKSDALQFPGHLSSGGPEMQKIIEGQKELFRTRKASHEAKNRILAQRIERLHEQIKGYEAQVESSERQLKLIAEEVSGKRELENKGYLPRPVLLKLLRMEAEISGQVGRYKASIAEAQQQIGEAEMQVLANDAERADRIATHLDEVQSKLNGIREKLLASRDVLDRTSITAPVSGTVVNLRFKTESGVVPATQPILDIVPSEEKLVIDARISPTDVDVVRKGLEAKVQLSAISSRSPPRIRGVVQSISADLVEDDKPGASYYLARVEIDRDELHRLAPDFKLTPGMPADVLIITGQRTMAEYILKPLQEAIWKSLREA